MSDKKFAAFWTLLTIGLLFGIFVVTHPVPFSFGEATVWDGSETETYTNYGDSFTLYAGLTICDGLSSPIPAQHLTVAGCDFTHFDGHTHVVMRINGTIVGVADVKKP